MPSDSRTTDQELLREISCALAALGWDRPGELTSLEEAVRVATAIGESLGTATQEGMWPGYQVLMGAHALWLASGVGPRLRAEVVGEAVEMFETARGILAGPTTITTQRKRTA